MELSKEYFEQQLSNLATKDDLLELATKNDLGSIRDDSKQGKARGSRMDQRTDEDQRAALRDIADLKTRLSVLERAVSHN